MQERQKEKERQEMSGARYRMFIPCQSGRCPEMMQLINYLTEHPLYKCPRKDCIFHKRPIPAHNLRQSLTWVQDGDKPKQNKFNPETAI